MSFWPRHRPYPRVRSWVLALSLVSLVSVSGSLACATYSDKTNEVRSAIDAGDLEGAVTQLNTRLEVDGPTEYPNEWKGDAPLLVLERATVLQALQYYEESASNFSAAESQLEFLDFYNDAGGKIAKYMFSDSATKYKSTPTEKLALNSLNMINYLRQRDLSGSRVEVKRFMLMLDYLRDYEPEAPHGTFGSYLSGFVFERLGDPTRALRHYEAALEARPFPSLATSLARLTSTVAFESATIAEATAGVEAPPEQGDMGEVLIVVKVGRVPHKVPVRLPIGAAIGIAGTYITGNPEFLYRAGMKVVVFPGLERVPSQFDSGRVWIGGVEYPLELASDLGADISREYEALKPRIVGSAITRMITRAAAGEGTRQATKKSGILGVVAALAVEGTMVALDRPDTRSWTTLPEKIFVLRTMLPPGRHELRIGVEGPGGSEEFAATVELEAGGFDVIDVTSLR